jgi:hypothetical protein
MTAPKRSREVVYTVWQAFPSTRQRSRPYRICAKRYEIYSELAIREFVLEFKIKDNHSMERVVHKTQLADRDAQAAADLRYWLSQPIQARLAAVELLREQMYPNYAQQGFQRVCRIVPLKAG